MVKNKQKYDFKDFRDRVANLSDGDKVLYSGNLNNMHRTLNSVHNRISSLAYVIYGILGLTVAQIGNIISKINMSGMDTSTIVNESIKYTFSSAPIIFSIVGAFILAMPMLKDFKFSKKLIKESYEECDKFLESRDL